MANAAVAITNLADSGTWSASSEEALMPVARLRNEHVGKRWRSTAEPAWALCDLGAERSFDTLALLGMTAGAGASVRTRVTSAAAGNDQYTKVLLHMDGADASTTFTDSNAGGSARTWTAAGDAQIDTAQSKFGGASGLFDGTGDYVSTPDHADFTLGSGDFTIDIRFRVNDAGGAFMMLAGQTDATGAESANSAWFIGRTSGNVIYAAVTSGTTQTQVTGTTQFTNAVNTGWHKAALVRTGNVLKLLVDGVQEGGNVAFSGAVNDSTASLAIGRRGDQASLYWNGWLDEFRMSVGIARWTGNHTPSALAYGDPAFGDLYDQTFDIDDAAFDPDYGMFVLPLAAPLTGRFVRFDIADAGAPYVEAGRGFVGLREAFTYNFVPGGRATWNDRSRRGKSAGGQTLVFPDNKFRTAEINFDFVPKSQRNGLWETMARVNGNAVDVLLILDTESDNLPRDSIFGLVTTPIGTGFTGIPDIYTAPLTVEERL